MDYVILWIGSVALVVLWTGALAFCLSQRKCLKCGGSRTLTSYSTPSGKTVCDWCQGTGKA